LARTDRISGRSVSPQERSFWSYGVSPVTYDSAQGAAISCTELGRRIWWRRRLRRQFGEHDDSGRLWQYLSFVEVAARASTNYPNAGIPGVPTQVLGAAASSQTITLANNTSAPLGPLTLSFSNEGDNTFGGQSDFNELPSFTEQDNCAASLGTNFSSQWAVLCDHRNLHAARELSVATVRSATDDCGRRTDGVHSRRARW